MTDLQSIGTNITISKNESPKVELTTTKDLCLKEKCINSLENNDAEGEEVINKPSVEVKEKENINCKSKSDGAEKKKNIASIMSDGVEVVPLEENLQIIDSNVSNNEGKSPSNSSKVKRKSDKANEKSKTKSKISKNDSAGKSKFKESVNQSTLNTFFQITPSTPTKKSKPEEGEEDNDDVFKAEDEPEKEGKIRISMNLFKSPRRSLAAKSKSCSKLSTSKKKSVLITSQNVATETNVSPTSFNTAETQALSTNEAMEETKNVPLYEDKVEKEPEIEMEENNITEASTSSANDVITESADLPINETKTDKMENKTDTKREENKAFSANEKIMMINEDSPANKQNTFDNEKIGIGFDPKDHKKEKISKNHSNGIIKSKKLKVTEKKSEVTKSKQKSKKPKKSNKSGKDKEINIKKTNKEATSAITDDDLDDFEVESNVQRNKSRSRQNTHQELLKIKNVSSMEISEDLGDETDKIKETMEIDDETDKRDKPKTAINAFQYMMDRRNKVIGSNSPGKDLDTSEEINLSQSDKDCKAKTLKSRKKLLEQWNEVKGGVKRKIIDVEREEYIDHALEKRAKRMKKLLKVDTTNSNEKSTPKGKHKKINKTSNSAKKKVKNKGQKLEIDLMCDEKNVKEEMKSKSDLQKKINHKKDCGEIEQIEDEEINIVENDGKTKPDGTVVNEVNHDDQLNKEEVKQTKIKPKNKNRKKIMRIESSSEENSNDATKTNECEEIIIASEESNDTLNKSNKVINNIKSPKTQTEILNFFDIVSKQKTDDKNKDPNQSLKKTKGKAKKSVAKKAIGGNKINLLTSESDTDSEKFPNKRRKGKLSKNRKISKTPNNLDKNITKKDVEICITLDDSKSAMEEDATKIINIISDESRKDADVDPKSEVDEVIADGPRRSTRTRNVLNYEEEEAKEEKIKCDKQTKAKAEPTKIAAIFLKAMPKPKIDPAILAARRCFLHSGVPDGLKKVMEKQQSVENEEYDVFPSISHIQQKDDDSTFWNLPTVELNLKPFESLHINTIQSENDISIFNNYELNNQSSSPLSPPSRKILLKPTVDEIKQQHPELPIYRIFKTLYDKSGFNEINQKPEPAKTPKSSTKRKKGRPKKRKPSDDDVIIIDKQQETECVNNLTWTDKYKPKSINEFIGNRRSVINLKNWLQNWIDFSKETKAAKRRRLESSDFESMDDNSRDSISSRIPKKTMILSGPPGCGKTTAVYAVCKDLNIKILELNASSKRTGKKLLQELQEATQSHQVHKKDNSLLSIIQTNNVSLETDQKVKKMCLLFIEDVDIVFDQDEGFVSSLTQLLLTSKRPIVMTTSGVVNWHMSKFELQYTTLSFKPFSACLLSVWLQMICLLEGVNISRNSLSEILDFNKGDIRKTLLYLQYWVQTGTKQTKIKSGYKIGNLIEKNNLGEDLSSVTYLEGEDPNLSSPEIYDSCLVPFLKHNSLKSVLPLNTKLSTIWWNLPDIFSIDNISHKNKSIEKKENTTVQKELKEISDFMDAISYTDTINHTAGVDYDLEPCYETWEIELKEGLSLSENMMNRETDWEFHNEFNHTLLDGYCRLQKNGNDVMINLAVPRSTEIRWRKKQEACSSTYVDAIPWSTSFPRSSFTCDYFPALRTITRSECVRNGNSTKRNNRFYNYLRTLNMNPSSTHIETASNMLVIKDS